jgi:hypothetical protein
LRTLLPFSCRCRYFQEVLLSDKLPADGNEIQLHRDGSWSSLVIEEELTTLLSPMVSIFYRGADKSLARPGRKQATVTEDFDDHTSYL